MVSAVVTFCSDDWARSRTPCLFGTGVGRCDGGRHCCARQEYELHEREDGSAYKGFVVYVYGLLLLGAGNGVFTAAHANRIIPTIVLIVVTCLEQTLDCPANLRNRTWKKIAESAHQYVQAQTSAVRDEKRYVNSEQMGRESCRRDTAQYSNKRIHCYCYVRVRRGEQEDGVSRGPDTHHALCRWRSLS